MARQIRKAGCGRDSFSYARKNGLNLLGSSMTVEIDEITRIAQDALRKAVSLAPEARVDIEEIEEVAQSGNFLVTVSFWRKDNRPTSPPGMDLRTRVEQEKRSLADDLLNPWRKKFKRVEVDPREGRAVAIRMYEPHLEVI